MLSNLLRSEPMLHRSHYVKECFFFMHCHWFDIDSDLGRSVRNTPSIQELFLKMMPIATGAFAVLLSTNHCCVAFNQPNLYIQVQGRPVTEACNRCEYLYILWQHTFIRVLVVSIALCNS